VMSQETDEDIHTLHNEAMQQRSHQVSALKKVNGSLIIKQRPLMRQNHPSQLHSQFQSVRTFHTQQCHQAAMNTNSAIGQDVEADVHKIHSEAMEQRSHQVASLNQMKSSLITKNSSLQRQTSPKHLDLQFQSVRSLHTNNVRILEFDEVPEETDVLDIHIEAIDQRQYHMGQLSQISSSLITNKMDSAVAKDKTCTHQ